jgi:hypothetical protein
MASVGGEGFAVWGFKFNQVQWAAAPELQVSTPFPSSPLTFLSWATGRVSGMFPCCETASTIRGFD